MGKKMKYKKKKGKVKGEKQEGEKKKGRFMVHSEEGIECLEEKQKMQALENK